MRCCQRITVTGSFFIFNLMNFITVKHIFHQIIPKNWRSKIRAFHFKKSFPHKMFIYFGVYTQEKEINGLVDSQTIIFNRKFRFWNECYHFPGWDRKIVLVHSENFAFYFVFIKLLYVIKYIFYKAYFGIFLWFNNDSVYKRKTNVSWQCETIRSRYS